MVLSPRHCILDCCFLLSQPHILLLFLLERDTVVFVKTLPLGSELDNVQGVVCACRISCTTQYCYAAEQSCRRGGGASSISRPLTKVGGMLDSKLGMVSKSTRPLPGADSSKTKI